MTYTATPFSSKFSSPMPMAEDSLLMIVDIQDKLLPAINQGRAVVSQAVKLVQGAGLLEIPVIVTEQYPQGLGPTDKAILKALPPSTRALPKTTFSSLGDAEIQSTVKSFQRSQLIICGIEAHICVQQTVSDAIAMGYQVFLVTDATSSRHKQTTKTALAAMNQAGALLTTVESILFSWLRDAKHPQFKAVQELIK